MKNLLAFICLISFCSLSYSQAPQKINYQGVVRDANGSIKPNSNVSIQLKLHYDNPSGEVIYQEEHMISTNDFGLFNIQIGTGTNPLGQFTLIDWGSRNVHIEVLMDITGGNSFTSLGSQEIVSVPYALYA